MSSPWKIVKELFGVYSGMLLISVIGLLLLLFGGIFPTLRQMDRTRGEIEQLRHDLQRRETLQPVYQMLTDRISAPLPADLALPDPVPLALADLPGVPGLLERIADEAGLEMISAAPQVASMAPATDSLRVDARARGNYDSMRGFLLLLGALPSMQRIEGLTIHTGESGLEMRLTLWLGIK